MPTTTILTNEVRADYTLTLNGGDGFVLARSATAVWDSIAIYSSITTTVGSTAIRIYGTFDLGTISTAGGSVYVGAEGSLYTAQGLRVGLAGYFSPSTVVNDGTIVCNTVNAAVYLYNGTNEMVNNGTISGLGGVILGQDRSAGDHLLNTGLISTSGWAVTLRGNDGFVENSGRIESLTRGIYVAGEADGFGGYNAVSQKVVNSGHVFGGDYGVQAVMQESGSVFNLVNTGHIGGGAFAIVTSAGTDTIINRGTIAGNVTLGQGNDTFDTRGGVVAGTVFGGDGIDTYITDDADLTIVETATAEVDFVRASVSFRLGDNVENLVLTTSADINGFGNALSNLLGGNAGSNRIVGLEGNDTVLAGLGDDRIFGGFGSDSLSGEDGDDLIQGQAGGDILRGFDGNDTLVGGGDRDTLSGSTGSDCFVFSTLAHTGNSTLTGDLITDLVAGEDVSDLSGIDAIRNNGTPNDAFTLAPGGLTGVAGQVALVQLAGNTYVQMDVNGDAIADAMIRVNGLPLLTAGDFLL